MQCRKAESGLFPMSSGPDGRQHFRWEFVECTSQVLEVQSFREKNIDSLKLELMEHYLKHMQKSCGMSPCVTLRRPMSPYVPYVTV